MGAAAVGLWMAGATPVDAGNRVTISFESGTPQSAPAYVAARADRYEAVFPHALAVRVSGPVGARIRFVCETAGCEFPPSEQGDSVHRIDARSFDVVSAAGMAAIKLIVSAPSPRTVVVLARPSGVRVLRNVRFVLQMR